MTRVRNSELVIIYWRDIPVQVTVQKGRLREKALLDPRFQQAVDRAAIVAGLTDTDSYVAEWRRESTKCDGDMAESVVATAKQLNDDYSDPRLERLVQAGGLEELAE
tara:strand:+ start:480 stop:800 length:321 start_codon:yes stop_codon:yes gene_type:complete